MGWFMAPEGFCQQCQQNNTVHIRRGLGQYLLITISRTACREKDNLLLKKKKKIKATFKESWKQKIFAFYLFFLLCRAFPCGSTPFLSCWLKFTSLLPWIIHHVSVQVQGCPAQCADNQTELLSLCHFNFARGNSLGAMAMESGAGHGCCRIFFFWKSKWEYS